MLTTLSDGSIQVIDSNNQEHRFTVEQFTRWLCLLEAISIIENKATELELDLENTDWVKPLSIQKYMNERFESVKSDVNSMLNGEEQIA